MKNLRAQDETGKTKTDTLDWEEHWKTESEPEGAREFAQRMAERLGVLIEDKEIRTVADYGCGPATALFKLAETFPRINFYGYDTAHSIVKRNREISAERGLGNLHFDIDCLPTPRCKHKFDLVTCFSTLHYIEEIEQAVEDLFELVNPGGFLIFNYPSRYTRSMFRRDIEPDDDYMRMRFALLLSGSNLISLRKIEEILGVKPKKFYSSLKSNIYVVIQKPYTRNQYT